MMYYNKYTKISGIDNIQKKIKDEVSGNEDYFYRTAASFRDRYFENEIGMQFSEKTGFPSVLL